MTFKRKPTKAYVDMSKENDRAICFNCHEQNVTVRLEKYKEGKQCPNCHKVYSEKDLIKYESVPEVLGKVGQLSDSCYDVAVRKRRIDRSNSDVFDVSQYPLAGQIDSDLQHFANTGIIVRIEDDIVGDE